jgi:hypothetical protein
MALQPAALVFGATPISVVTAGKLAGKLTSNMA